MRLIDTSTFELSEFIGNRIPLYAILSHRWNESEVTYQQLRDGTWLELAGAAKLRGCCAQAAKDGFQWVWIDSCCIDKSSSAELSEAINSMFKWYQRAQVCYAYLSDVTSPIDDVPNLHEQFGNSQWFKRGWTLQELLAPQNVEFYNRDWVEIGTKSSLADTIKDITGIDRLFDSHLACAAQKMSWVAKRETTREEDIAYCLMGLFGVNMPTLYGEGSKAFLRLQSEILNKSEDESIFAWESLPFQPQSIDTGLLAHSHKWFEGCADVRKSRFDLQRLPHTMTNRGLRMELLIATVGAEHNGERLVIAPLNCMKIMRTDTGAMTWKTICLSLQGNWNDSQVRFYTRRKGLVYNAAVANAANRNIFIKETFFFKQYEPIRLESVGRVRRPVTLLVRAKPLLELGFRPRDLGPKFDTTWDIECEEEPCFSLSWYDFDVAPLVFARGSAKLFLFLGRTGRIKRIWFDVSVGESGFVLEQAWAAIKVREHAATHGPDRLSRLLENGTSVSFALKKSIHKGELAYVVEITVDAEGKPRWPTTQATEVPVSAELRKEQMLSRLELESEQ